MVSIIDFGEKSRISGTSDRKLKAILNERQRQLADSTNPLGDGSRFTIVEPRDQLNAIEQAFGFSVVTDLVEGVTYGDPDFAPSWEWAEDHGGWFELVFILSDDGFAHVLFVPDRDDVDATLLAMCREHCRRADEQSAVDPPPGLKGPFEL